ncbi:hypothetical protein HPB47_007394 [Ixodes persulcatus]|uniref:Uncharacterized protein n=1 Tax=Ixodes persulcatus TaxID=34615 RepID=A0AC60P896_IXOPE|nr:hypothetical protein HPB47_007394 [Ixodes persulcatus]
MLCWMSGFRSPAVRGRFFRALLFLGGGEGDCFAGVLLSLLLPSVRVDEERSTVQLELASQVPELAASIESRRERGRARRYIGGT